MRYSKDLLNYSKEELLEAIFAANDCLKAHKGVDLSHYMHDNDICNNCHIHPRTRQVVRYILGSRKDEDNER